MNPSTLEQALRVFMLALLLAAGIGLGVRAFRVTRRAMSEPAGRRRLLGSLQAGAAILLLGWIAWSITMRISVDRPDRAFHTSESAVLTDVAREITRDQGYRERFATPVVARAYRGGPPYPAQGWAPFYPSMLGIGMAMFDAAPRLPIVLNALGFAVSLLLLLVLGRLVVGGPWAFIPPICMAMSPRMLDAATYASSQGWTIALLLGLFCLLFARRPSTNHVVAAGLAAALLLLTRASTFFYLPTAIVLTMRPVRWPRRAAAGDAGEAPPSKRLALTLFTIMFTLMLLPWLFYRFQVYGTVLPQFSHYALLDNLGPWSIGTAMRNLLTPEPWSYVLAHPFEFVGKMIVGAVKVPLLVVFRLLNPVEVALVAVGAAVLAGEAVGRRFVASVLLLVVVQWVIAATTNLESEPWLALLPFAWIALAAGARSLSRRLLRDWPEIAAVAVVGVAALLPFGHAALDTYLTPRPGDTRMTESDWRALGTWTGALVPERDAVATELGELVWYADRNLVCLPSDPAQLPELMLMTRASFVLWPARTNTLQRNEEWLRFFDEAMRRERLEPLAELRLDSGDFVLAVWRSPFEPN